MSKKVRARRHRIQQLLKRDGGACSICGGPLNKELGPDDPHAITIDHAVPRAAGGSSELSNLRLAHRKCNQLRGAVPLGVPLGAVAHKTPIPPHWFRRYVFTGFTGGVFTLGFSVRFPGRTPDNARHWLKAHGYKYYGREWNRVDRKPCRVSYQEYNEHRRRVAERRRRVHNQW